MDIQSHASDVPSEHLFYQTYHRAIPLACTIELTRRCHLSCIHCYLPETQGRNKFEPHEELSTAEWKIVFQDLAENGCLYLTFTGGEIFLRHDIDELIRHARSLSFDVRLFTTGSFITDSETDLVAELCVSAVELSLYGKPETHDRVTRSSGSFSRTVAAAESLRQRGISVVIKCPMMKINFNDRYFLVRLAREKGFQLSIDPTLCPSNDSRNAILDERICPEEMAKLFDDPIFSRTGSTLEPHDTDPANAAVCSAGRNMCGINPYGEVYPCLQVPVALGNVRQTPFSDIWSHSALIQKFRAITLSDIAGCAQCRIAGYCRRCPGIALLEDKNLLGPSHIACELARIQYQQYRGKTSYIPPGLITEVAYEYRSEEEKAV
jgi:AdoMet-dependent heme synthase